MSSPCTRSVHLEGTGIATELLDLVGDLEGPTRSYFVLNVTVSAKDAVVIHSRVDIEGPSVLHITGIGQNDTNLSNGRRTFGPKAHLFSHFHEGWRPACGQLKRHTRVPCINIGHRAARQRSGVRERHFVDLCKQFVLKPADALMELYGNEITSSGPGTEHVIFARGTIVATGTKLFSDDMLSYGPGSNVDYPSEEGFVKASALSRWKCWCHHSAGVPETVTIWRCGVTLYSVSEGVASVHVAAKPRSLGCQITR